MRSLYAVAQICAMAGGVTCATAAGRLPVRTSLKDHWALRSSCEVRAGGAQISSPGFNTEDWHQTSAPSTVVGALVADKTYPDPYFGTNLRSFPGANYPIGSLFSNRPMPEGSPFKCSWWYRTEFELPAGPKGDTVWLHFDGINYRANVWLNGQKVADAKDVVGTFRQFEFNVTGAARRAGANGLAVEIFAPDSPESLALTWVDWNPAPPDKDMGLWKDVYVTASGPVTVRDAFVNSKLDSGYTTATLAVSATLRNSSQAAISGVLNLRIGNIQARLPVEMAAGQQQTVRFDAGQFPQLKLRNPKLWWPYQMGMANMYTANLDFESGKEISDAAEVRFGIREVKTERTEQGALLFRVNGKRVLIRGAAWSPDMLLRWSKVQAETGIGYSKDMGMNAIRLEGKFENEEFFDMADEQGMLIMPGWCCCDFWERWKRWKPEHYTIAKASMADQLRRLRKHPSVFVFLYASDGPPPADVERMYLDVIKDVEWPNPTISSGAADPGPLTGASGVKMTGPYDYEPPNYWLVDKEAGGAYGFNTETSPGPAIPTLESLRRFLPADHLWPIDEVWNYHAGGERFKNINLYLNGLEQRYGKAESLEDFLRKSQAVAYDGQRAMFEAYGRNKYVSTGVIQWMLNNAWPSLIWHLYDYYLVPAGGYYGTKKACEPVHVQYSYDNHSVAVVNNQDRLLKAMRVEARIYGVDASEKYSHAVDLDIPADGSVKAFDLPADGLDKTYFLRLQLKEADGKLVSDNFYWLSTKPDVLAWKKRRGTAYTPQAEFGDLTALNRLPKVNVQAETKVQNERTEGLMHVTLRNPSTAVAFMVHLRVTQGPSGEDVTPIYWDDNYVSLMPGEERRLTARYDAAALGGKTASLAVDGWNVARK